MTLDKLLELSKRESDVKFIEEEQRRIEPWVCQGDMQAEVQIDMGRWAKDTGIWGDMHYSHIVAANAEARGWTQKGFTGLEMPHES